MYEIFTLIHSEKNLFFLLKHCIRIHQLLYFNLKSTGEVIMIPLTFSYKI